jgi:hypothetical protein
MEKQKKRHKVYSQTFNNIIEISKLREDLDCIEKLGVTHIEIDSGYASNYVNVEAFSERIETDEEYDIRITRQKRRDLSQLENIKSKYGIK